MLPTLLPSIAHTRQITQALAMLDAILCPEWEDRYYSFNSAWGDGEEMASMRNGSGDDWFLLLDSNGTALKGFAHELTNDDSFPQSIQNQVPRGFSSFLNEPAFSMQHATFCYWRELNDLTWSKASGFNSEDGSEEMLALLVSGPSGYKEWAESYFEVPVALDAVSAVFAHRPLSDSIILQLNPAADLDFVYSQATEIGYPRLAV